MRYIRNKFGDVIYCIRDDGTITDKFDCDVIGHLNGDRITDKFNIDTLYRIRQDGTITDKYDCDIIGHIRDDGTITDKYDIGTYGKVDVSNSSSGSSDSGCLYSLFYFIGFLLRKIIIMIFICLKVIVKYAFLYYMLPFYASVTIYYLIAGVLSILLLLSTLGIVFGIIDLFVVAISIPYWIILFIQKRKRKMTWKETLKYYGKWFIKGPWAYKDIMELKNRPMDN